MGYKLNQSCSADGTSSITQSEFMLLLKYGAKEPKVSDMITWAKRMYVEERHTNTIFQMKNASGYKKDKWKTYVGKGKARKELVRKTEDELYSALYERYRAIEEKPKTLEEVFESLVEYKELFLNRDPHTIRDDRRRFAYISDDLKQKSIADITDEDIQLWLVREFLPKKPKAASLRKQLQLFNQIFRHGIKKKICVDNPLTYISAQDYLHKCDLTVKKDEKKAFSEKQMELINADIEKDLTNPRALIALMAEHTGMRVGELVALHKSDVYPDKGYIHVHRQQHPLYDSEGHLHFEELPFTKDEKKHPHGGRKVPIIPECQRVIDLAMELKGKSEYLFHDAKGNWVSEDSYLANLRKRCRRVAREVLKDESLTEEEKQELADIPTNNHAFRIAFNSQLIDCGLNARERALILGHSVETNERFYSKRDERSLESIASRLAHARLESSLSAKAHSVKQEEPAELLL